MHWKRFLRSQSLKPFLITSSHPNALLQPGQVQCICRCQVHWMSNEICKSIAMVKVSLWLLAHSSTLGSGLSLLVAGICLLFGWDGSMSHTSTCLRKTQEGVGWEGHERQAGVCFWSDPIPEQEACVRDGEKDEEPGRWHVAGPGNLTINLWFKLPTIAMFKHHDVLPSYYIISN